MKKILIVEDEEISRSALVKRISEENFITFEARDGQEGLNVAMKINPDLILLDIVMPVMNGMTMLEKLRANESTKNIPVILLTNLEDQNHVAEAIKNNVYDYLIKVNFSLDDVVHKIKEKLGIQ